METSLEKHQTRPVTSTFRRTRESGVCGGGNGLVSETVRPGGKMEDRQAHFTRLRRYAQRFSNGATLLGLPVTQDCHDHYYTNDSGGPQWQR